MSTKVWGALWVTLLLLQGCAPAPAPTSPAEKNSKAVLGDGDVPDVDEAVAAFHADPAKFMDQELVKRNAVTGEIVKEPGTAFSEEEIQSGEYVIRKDLYRTGEGLDGLGPQKDRFCVMNGGRRVCLSEVEPGRAPIGAGDRVENLVDNPNSLILTLDEMEIRGLMSASLSESPWSDNYWPIYQGILGARYADPEFAWQGSWKESKAYVDRWSVNSLLNSADASSLDNLSPSEKYDLLIGDSDGTLTRQMWESGQRYQDAYGKVETWMGICHGWAPASYSLPRPSQAITVDTPSGFKIRFYPSDLKALGSLLWANGNYRSKFSGARCNEKNPEKDSNGRIISPRCFDTNPGAWHLAMVNQIGVSKRGMVLDATYDYEVWNQPIYSYSYRYFNPITGAKSDTVTAARVLLAAHQGDKFKSYRSSNARYLVGVAMDVTYGKETRPTHRQNDAASFDYLETVTYHYDLELDSSGRIIGGEWYTNKHPDFLWTPGVGIRPKTAYDVNTDWDANGVLPVSVQKKAQAAAEDGQPLPAVVDALIGRSHLEGSSNL